MTYGNKLINFLQVAFQYAKLWRFNKTLRCSPAHHYAKLSPAHQDASHFRCTNN